MLSVAVLARVFVGRGRRWRLIALRLTARVRIGRDWRGSRRAHACAHARMGGPGEDHREQNRYEFVPTCDHRTTRFYRPTRSSRNAVTRRECFLNRTKHTALKMGVCRARHDGSTTNFPRIMFIPHINVNSPALSGVNSMLVVLKAGRWRAMPKSPKITR